MNTTAYWRGIALAALLWTASGPAAASHIPTDGFEAAIGPGARPAPNETEIDARAFWNEIESVLHAGAAKSSAAGRASETIDRRETRPRPQWAAMAARVAVILNDSFPPVTAGGEVASGLIGARYAELPDGSVQRRFGKAWPYYYPLDM